MDDYRPEAMSIGGLAFFRSLPLILDTTDHKKCTRHQFIIQTSLTISSQHPSGEVLGEAIKISRMNT